MFNKIKSMTNNEIINRIQEIDNIIYTNLDIIDNVLVNLWNEQNKLIYEITVTRGCSVY